MTIPDYRAVIDRFYEPGSALRRILIDHSRSVADKALELNTKHGLALDPSAVEAGAMLHDIGIFLCDAPGIECHGPEPYLRHGVLGAALLRSQELPEWVARIAERHTGAGITAAEIAEHGMPLPMADYVPETMLEKLICYADKFYSKSGDMAEKPIEKILSSMARHGAEPLRRFVELHHDITGESLA
jgi:uncharacterized protein